MKICFALKFKFDMRNNEVEYEVLITDFKLTKEVKVDNLKVFSDSQLAVQ